MSVIKHAGLYSVNLTLTFELGVDGVRGHHDTPPDLDRVGAVGDRVEPCLGDSPGKDGGGGGAVAGLLVGVVGHVHHQLGANVLELVLQLHRLSHGNAVLCENDR